MATSEGVQASHKQDYAATSKSQPRHKWVTWTNQHQGIRSTKQPTITNTDDYRTPVQQTKTNDNTRHVYMKITNINDKLYIDQTG